MERVCICFLFLSPSDIKYYCKKYSKLFQRTFAAESTSTKSPLFHRNIQTCGKLLLISPNPQTGAVKLFDICRADGMPFYCCI